MAIKDNSQLSFADVSASNRKCKHTFFDQINILIDWHPIQALLKRYYPKGHSDKGRRAYDPLFI